MKISPQIIKSPNKRVQRVTKSPQISKVPNKRARVRDANYNLYDHNPNGVKSHIYGYLRGGINE